MHGLPLHPIPFDAEVAIRRATGAADSVSGAFLEPPCRFWPLSGYAERLVAHLRSGGHWILVTCQASAEPAHAAHLRERCLTAAQRFALSLWSDGIDAVWVGEGVPDPGAFQSAGVHLGAAEPVGLIWVSAA